MESLILGLRNNGVFKIVFCFGFSFTYTVLLFEVGKKFIDLKMVI